MELKALRMTLAGYPYCDVVRNEIGLLVRYDPSFAGRKIHGIADRPDMFPTRLQRVIVDRDPLRFRYAAIKEHLSGTVRWYDKEEIVAEIVPILGDNSPSIRINLTNREIEVGRNAALLGMGGEPDRWGGCRAGRARSRCEIVDIHLLAQATLFEVRIETKQRFEGSGWAAIWAGRDTNDDAPALEVF